MKSNELLQEKPLFNADFYSKVYAFFGMAILSSALGAYLGLNYFAQYFIANPTLIYSIFFLELVLIFTSKMWSQKIPLNYWLFFAFALLTGITIVPLLSVVLVVGGADMLMKALFTTALMFGAAAVFGATTNYNLQGLRGFLMLSLIGLIIISLIGIFLPWGNQFEIIISGFGILLFAGYTMYDIQKLKHYDENQYVDAALQLYLNLFNLFIFVLRMILALSRR